MMGEFDFDRELIMRKPLIAGNWKMHGSLHGAEQLLRGIIENHALPQTVECAVFPPFVHIPLCQTLLSQSTVQYGAQNCSEYTDGAYTGEVSAVMLKALQCRYVIVGHSERRQYFHETNAIVEKKCSAAFEAGLIPILCVGETLSEREQSRTFSVVQEQLEVACRLKDNCTAFTDIIIAYEPVWAIGTGKSATPELAQAVHEMIRAQLKKIGIAEKTRVLYGGSVKPDNAAALFAMPDIDGALVGGASLHADDFVAIAKCYK
jgi:triosephosphate isomerase